MAAWLKLTFSRVFQNLTRKGKKILSPLIAPASRHETDLLSELDVGNVDQLKIF